MVSASADRLNLDCLELIFAHLSGNDLPSVALVSRAFLSGVIPRLYCKLVFRLSHSKRYPKVISPFSAILMHPELAVHVRHVDIRTIPKLSVSLKSQHHPLFIRECIDALDLCCNLWSFKCVVNVIPAFLPSLQGKRRLEDVRVNANLTEAQSAKLVLLTGLRTVALDSASWSVIDMLPKWSSMMKNTLTTLTIYNTAELNECVLESVLSQLPQLLGLHVIGCYAVDHVAVLRLVEHTPLLESLSLSTWENSRALIMPPSRIFHLRNLSLDCKFALITSPAPTAPSSILAHIRSSSAPISSFTLKLSDGQIQVADSFVQELLNAHGATLRSIAFLNCAVSIDSIKSISRRAIRLERLHVPVPVKEFRPFTTALAPSSTLKTVVDVGNSHANHGPQPTLSKENVRHIMRNVAKLRKIISGNRIWTGHPISHAMGLRVVLERQRTQSENYWFISQDLASASAS